jgi:hypothetical protein
MNIKRMAREYRLQVMGTGQHIRDRIRFLLTLVSKTEAFDHHDVAAVRRLVRGRYNSLHRSLGSGKDLKGLYLCWATLKNMSRIVRQREKDGTKSRAGLVADAQAALGHFDIFYKKLPEVVEKSLIRSVLKSGILPPGEYHL